MKRLLRTLWILATLTFASFAIADLYVHDLTWCHSFLEHYPACTDKMSSNGINFFRLEGRVIDENGYPVDAALVKCYQETWDGEVQTLNTQGTYTTPEGDWQFWVLTPMSASGTAMIASYPKFFNAASAGVVSTLPDDTYFFGFLPGEIME